MKKAAGFVFIVFAGIFCVLSCKKPERTSLFNLNIDLSGTVESRIQRVPLHVIDWLKDLDSADNYRPYMPTEDERALFADYLQLLPETYIQLMKEKVIAFYFIENFTGGGMTMWDLNKKGDMFFFLFFNPEILKRTLNDWINNRENSTFYDDDSGFALVSECTGGYFALIHTLVHEAAHVYDYCNHITPFTEPELKNESSPLQTDFTIGIWDDYKLPDIKNDFLYRSELSAYGFGQAQERSLAPEIFHSLSNTPFPSLYGSQNWAEDFAESFTWFYLAEYLNVMQNVKVIDTGTNEEIIRYEAMQNPLFVQRFGVFTDIIH
jgi:hypothetical protein